MRTAKLAVFVGLVAFLATCCFPRQAAGAEKERFHDWNLKKVAEVTKETTTKTVIKVVPEVLEKALENAGKAEKTTEKVRPERKAEKKVRKKAEKKAEATGATQATAREHRSTICVYVPTQYLGLSGVVNTLRRTGYEVTTNPTQALLILSIDINREERGSFGGGYGGSYYGGGYYGGYYGSPGRALQNFFSNHRRSGWGNSGFFGSGYGHFSDLGARGTLYKCRAILQDSQGRIVAYGESSSLGGFEVRIPSRYVRRIGIPDLGGAERSVRSAVERMIADHQLSLRAASSRGR